MVSRDYVYGAWPGTPVACLPSPATHVVNVAAAAVATAAPQRHARRCARSGRVVEGFSVTCSSVIRGCAKIDPTQAATVVLPIRVGGVVVMEHKPGRR